MSDDVSVKEFMQEALASPDDGIIPKGFTGVPVIAAFADWDYYYLHAPLSWEPDDEDSAHDPVTVTTGFVCDLASTPKALWSWLPRTARYTAPAIIHDFLYWFQMVSREEADDIFNIGMKELDVSTTKRIAIFESVRKLGGRAWKNNRKLRENGEKRILKKFPPDLEITWEEWKKDPSVFM